MKIIGGEFRGRRIELPKGADIRPTSDKVREAIFNIIRDRVRDVRVLDLFAGSGSLGLEALSRGAAEVTFVDIQKRCADSIRRSLKGLPIDKENVVDICQSDALKALKKLSDSKRRFDIVFMDPPYYGEWIKKCLISLNNYDILNNPPLIICEHFKKDVVPEEIGTLKRSRQVRYGDTVLSFYVRKNI